MTTAAGRVLKGVPRKDSVKILSDPVDYQSLSWPFLAEKGGGLPTRAFERKGTNNMTEDPDKLYTPNELAIKIPHFGLRMQRERRKDGTFIPFIELNGRIFYRESAIAKWLDEAEQRGGE